MTTDPVVLTITTTKGVIAWLKHKAASGLYGATLEETAERVLARAMDEHRNNLFESLPADKRMMINGVLSTGILNRF